METNPKPEKQPEAPVNPNQITLEQAIADAEREANKKKDDSQK